MQWHLHRTKKLLIGLLLVASALVYPVRNYVDLYASADANEQPGVDAQAAISAGWLHNCAVTESGGIKCWGANNLGQLGIGNTTTQTSAVAVSTLTSGVTAVAVGESHTCALRSGSVSCWGQNDQGQLGDGTAINRSAPVEVISSGVIAIASGHNHTCAVLATGGVQCWGENTYGQLGNSSTTAALTPVNVSGLPPSGKTVTAITANIYHSCALISDGTVQCWGRNFGGMLGDNSTTTRTSPVAVSGITSGATAISAGYFHTCAVVSGSLRCWGYNDFGYIGDGTTTQRITPVSVSNLPPSGKTVTAVSTGYQHTCALISDGSVQCWGRNNSGQNGDGSTTQRNTPVAVSGLTSGVAAITTGENHSCALLTIGGIRCWGINDSRQLGDGTTTNRSSPVRVFGIANPDNTAPTGLVAVPGVGAMGPKFDLTWTQPTDNSGLTDYTIEYSTDNGSTWTTFPRSASPGTTFSVYPVTYEVNYQFRVTAVFGSGSGTTSTSTISAKVDLPACAPEVSPNGLTSVFPVGACIYTVPTGVSSLTLDIRGAAGGGGDGNWGKSSAVGGVAFQGRLTVTAGETLYLYVGDQGTSYSANTNPLGGRGGFNGGGFGGEGTGYFSGGGGGATDIRTALNNLSTRLVVAGGAGGGGVYGNSCCSFNGGRGGITTGEQQTSSDGSGGTGGTQSAGGSGGNSGALGIGGTGPNFIVSTDGVGPGGGGGGFYGGGSGYRSSGGWISGGGGGSSLTNNARFTYTTTSPSYNCAPGFLAITIGSDRSQVPTVPSGCASQDVTSPTLNSVATNSAGTQITLTYSEALSATTAEISAFSVQVDGVARTVNSRSVSGSTVVLTLASAVNSGQAVTVAYTDPSSGNDSYAIQDAVGNDAATFAARSVTNNSTVDVTAPTFVSASTNTAGTTVTLTYSEALSATTAAASAFSVMVGGVSRSVSSAAVSGSTVVLTLASAIVSGQSVTVAYTDPTGGNDANAVQDSAGNDAVSLAATSVTNNSTVDATAPTFVSASTNTAGTTVTLTYSEALSATTAAASAFSVMVGGVSRSVSSAAVSGSTVVLTLASAIVSGQSVTVAYTDPTGGNDANAVQDSAGNDAVSLAATSVTNNSTVDATAPTFVSASTNTAGTTVTLTYSEALSATTAAAGAFSVMVGGVSRSVSSAAVSGSTVVLTLASAIVSGQSVTVAYTDPTSGNDANAVQDSAGNDAVSLAATSVTNNSTVDATAPTFVSASTNTAGTTVTLTYSEALSATTAAASAFSVVVGGVSVTPTGVSVSGSTVVLTLGSAIVSGQSVTVAYTDPTSGNDANAVQDSAGNDAVSLAATSVTNNSTVDATAPTFVSASTNTAGTQITLTYSEAMSATTASASAFTVVVDGTTITPSSVSASGSTIILSISPTINAGSTVTVAYADPSAGNDSNAVQDTTGNDAASFSTTSVTNNSTADTVTPSFVSASTNTAGTTVTLTYSEPLSATTAAASAFSVMVGGVSRSVSSAAVSGSTVVLTLASAVTAGQSVTVAYTDPTGGDDASAVQDRAGNDAATFAATAVTNNTASTPSNAVPTATTTSSTTSSTTTTVLRIVPTATTAAPRRTTTTTSPRRVSTTTSTSSTLSPATSSSIPRSSTTLPITTTALPTTTSLSTTTTSSVVRAAPTTSTTVAQAKITELAVAEEILQTAKSTASDKVLEAQISVADLRIAVMDQKSAVVVAVRDAEALVKRLSAENAPSETIVAAQEKLQQLKVAVAETTSISIEQITEAKKNLDQVLANPRATAEMVANAVARLVDARTPSFEEAIAIVNEANADYTLPKNIVGVVNNAGNGNYVILDNGAQRSIELKRVNQSVMVLSSSDGLKLTISAVDKDGNPIEFNSKGAIVVKHGNFISISGEGFAPGTTTKTWLFSSPRELGTVNVDANGVFSAEFPIQQDVRIGDHIAQVNGLGLDGNERSVNLDVEIRPSSDPAPYDPLSQPENVLKLIAELVSILVVVGAATRRKEEDDRESGELADVAVAYGSADQSMRRDKISVLALDSLDRMSSVLPRQCARLSPLFGRIVDDGVYLRSLLGALWSAMPVIGAVVGFIAARNTGFEATMPSLALLTAFIVIGTFDALSGFVAATMFSLAVGISGGVNSADSIRGLLGIWVLCFATPLIAAATRPFRRASRSDQDMLWLRSCDLVLAVLIGAWTAGAMYSALPGLTGFNSSSAGFTNHIRIAALLALSARFVLENLAAGMTPIRLKRIRGNSENRTNDVQEMVSILVRTAVYMFVAVAFIGNNWALWIGGLLYLVPKVVSRYTHALPNVALLHQFLPRGVVKVVVMLFVARWWGTIVAEQIQDPANMIKIGFVVLGIPGLILTMLGWFARTSLPWPSTLFSKILGVMTVVVGVLTVLGVFF